MRLRGKNKPKGNASSSSNRDIDASSAALDGHTESDENHQAVKSEQRSFVSAVTVTEMGDFHSSSDIQSSDSQQSDASEPINHLHHNPLRTKDVLK